MTDTSKNDNDVLIPAPMVEGVDYQVISAAELTQRVAAYRPDAEDLPMIARAYEFAKLKHAGQTRSSGEPYYTHPVEVSLLLVDMKMDVATICTAILHDTIEDTDATFEEVSRVFSEEIATLVNGVSKLTKIESQTVEGKQAENFRKLVLAISEDIRVLLVKLADRLHNMRTLQHLKKPDKRRRIARETLDIYAPLAERIGLHRVKEELEDLAFSYLNPEARESIGNRLSFLREEGSGIVQSIIKDLEKLLKETHVVAEVTGREKTRYSIWKKMQHKNVTFEQLSDIMAFRVVVDNLEQCYMVLGIIHSHFPTVPGRFKDYISTPKSNGYRSIHTTVIGPEKQRIEVQIRTHDMHEEADLGVAAHWSYKGGRKKADVNEARKYRWLRDLMDIMDQAQRPEEFLENTKLELFQDQVYVFTPKGDLIELPTGATSVDFAYAIHSKVGDRCVGAKINGRIAPLNTRLKNGDQVDIVTSKNQNPSPTWERFVVTGKAKSHIRRYVRQQQRDEYVNLGRAMLQRYFKQEGYDYNEKALNNISSQFVQCDEGDDVLVGIGSGHIAVRDVFKAIYPSHQFDAPRKTSEDFLSTLPTTAPKRPTPSGTAMPIKGLIPGMAVHFARCCHPMRGDRIVGIVSTGKGVTVHTIDCDTLENFADTPERWIEVSWSEGEEAMKSFTGRLNMTMLNESGALASVSMVIAKSGGNIQNLRITSRTTDFWHMLIDVQVDDTKHLNNIMASLRATSQVIEVERGKPQ